MTMMTFNGAFCYLATSRPPIKALIKKFIHWLDIQETAFILKPQLRHVTPTSSRMHAHQNHLSASYSTAQFWTVKIYTIYNPVPCQHETLILAQTFLILYDR
ncbi:predicted protein [Sclerotinia sclerotiorum 1980 UF-70]|uniref:Uncharacterized protein n=1 Tax=Sclerotinia sclerotiorum (strain ATCC 18683 / 1980 / Ss-1) TaxID=665079 RepID=A7EYL9_SCLS1|nr:predicted protein [Sclerotinia sclerotiorum 1980 UF-70]EDN94561.1 predicted protein [Sclerotinia sclerotiorum 1980 UF-70]